jgi:hypothetical protein
MNMLDQQIDNEKLALEYQDVDTHQEPHFVESADPMQDIQYDNSDNQTVDGEYEEDTYDGELQAQTVL